MKFLKPLFFFLLIFFLVTAQAQAQLGDYLEDEGGSLWEQEGFIDPTGTEFETGGGDYVGDEQVKALEEAARQGRGPAIDLASALEKDKALLPDNVLWGVGTGLVIGGWFSLNSKGGAQQNLRYIGTGIVLGAGLGVMMGTKSVYQPLLNSGLLPSSLSNPELSPGPQRSRFATKPQADLARLSWGFSF